MAEFVANDRPAVAKPFMCCRFLKNLSMISLPVIGGYKVRF